MVETRSLWVKNDVNFDDDSKIIEAGPIGETLYQRCLRLAKRNASDGHIERAQMIKLARDLVTFQEDVVETLVRVGLVEQVDGDYVIPGWENWNDPVEQMKKSRRKGAAITNHGRYCIEAGKPFATCPVCHGEPVASDSLSDRSPSLEKSESESESKVLRAADGDAASDEDPWEDVPETPTVEAEPAADEPKSKSPSKRKRAPDPLWDALVAWLGAGPETTSERGRWNRAVKELREANATPDDIAARGAEYDRRFPNVDRNPNALAANWGKLSTRIPGAARNATEAEAALMDRLANQHSKWSCSTVDCAECAAIDAQAERAVA